jgi:hypothetical protein
MAQNLNIPCPAGVWTLLTDAAVTALRVQNSSGLNVHLMATVGLVPPTDTSGSLTLGPQQTLAADLSLAQLWPGVAGANRVYAYAFLNASLSVSHA